VRRKSYYFAIAPILVFFLLFLYYIYANYTNLYSITLPLAICILFGDGCFVIIFFVNLFYVLRNAFRPYSESNEHHSIGLVLVKSFLLFLIAVFTGLLVIQIQFLGIYDWYILLIIASSGAHLLFLVVSIASV